MKLIEKILKKDYIFKENMFLKFSEIDEELRNSLTNEFEFVEISASDFGGKDDIIILKNGYGVIIDEEEELVDYMNFNTISFTYKKPIFGGIFNVPKNQKIVTIRKKQSKVNYLSNEDLEFLLT